MNCSNWNLKGGFLLYTVKNQHKKRFAETWKVVKKSNLLFSSKQPLDNFNYELFENIRFCPSPLLVGWRTAASWLDRCNVVIAVPPVPVPMNTFAVALLSVAHWGNRSSSNHNHVIGSYLSLSAPPLLLVGAPLFYLVLGLIAYDMSWNLASNKFSLLAILSSMGNSVAVV